MDRLEWRIDWLNPREIAVAVYTDAGVRIRNWVFQIDERRGWGSFRLHPDYTRPAPAGETIAHLRQFLHASISIDISADKP